VSRTEAAPVSWDELLDRLSHEFKTPLVSIKGHAELLLDRAPGGLDPTAREWVRRIAAAANRLNAVLRKVTAEAHTREAWTYLARPVDPGGWVESCLAEARTLGAGRRLSWECRVHDGLPPVAVDPEAGRDALLELLQNAARATPDGGTVRVHAVAFERAGTPGVRVTVEDTGIGLPEGGEAERCFERFVTLTPLHAHHSGDFEFGAVGLGLGLPMVRGIARAHGGEAWAEGMGRDPERMPGARVHLWLPAASAGERQAPAAGGRVLLIEPDPQARQVLAKGLAPRFEVVTPDDPEEAVKLWAWSGPWTGAVVEPRGGGGPGLVARLTSVDGRAPVVVYTAGPASDAAFWRRLGADAWVSKPARARTLRQHLERLAEG